MNEANTTRDYDWWLLAIVAAICALGVVEIYSATHGSALAGMHTKQIRWLVIGFVVMFVLSRLDYHVIMDQAPVLYIVGIVALIAVLAFGHRRFGAQRWIPILGEFFQVSELVKLIIIIVLARFFAEVRTDELSLQDLMCADPVRSAAHNRMQLDRGFHHAWAQYTASRAPQSASKA